MDLSFYKIKLFRSDFILVAPGMHTIDDTTGSAIAARMLPRRGGIGGSGLILLDKSNGAMPMRLFDKRGERINATGDSVLCASRYLFDSGRTNGRSAGIVNGSTLSEVGILDSNQFELDLGCPENPRTGERFDPSPKADATEQIEVAGQRYPATAVALSVACIVFVPAPRTDLRLFSHRLDGEIGAGSLQPAFVRPISPEEHRLTAWPFRESIDCSAIVGCAAVAAVSSGFGEGIMLSKFARMTSFVRWDRRKNRVVLTAAPEYVFSGNYEVEI